ncbi:hypothetical protein ACJDU8_17125 [Clostridium sp. WILCCON 0269]|uniref:Capsid protein n=1 Tax=Candidatus Clostridium eludens TaxID=3381663 RepID=A0ABW8SPJ6_9CLOT
MAITENFYYNEGSASVKNLIKTLVQEITQKPQDIYKWSLVYPNNIDSIGAAGTPQVVNLITDGSTTDKVATTTTVTNQNDTVILSTTTSYGKTFYVKIWRESKDMSSDDKSAIQVFKKLKPVVNGQRTDAQVLEIMAGVTPKGSDGSNAIFDDPQEYADYVVAIQNQYTSSLNNLRIEFSDKINSDGSDLVIPLSTSQRKLYNYRLSWYASLQNQIQDFLPVQYWINVTKDAINLVLRGDPSADVAPYENYLTGYAYMGAVKPVEDSAYTDDEYNFGVTTSADVEPNYSNPYGVRTGTGITDVCMLATKIGMPYQPHYPAFYATNPFMDKCNVEGSRWDHKKHQFSDVTIVHPVDMERGKLINILVGDASSIYDADKLTFMKDTDQEENYRKFKITAPYNFLNNSANINYCVAIRCYQSVE